MKKLEKIDSLTAFAKTYDAGGFFWSPFTRARDGEITAGEIARQAGRFTADSVALLRLEMHLDGLRPAERDEALRMLGKSMQARREKHLPERPSPTRFVRDLAPLKTGIITGLVVPLADPMEFARGLFLRHPMHGKGVPVWFGTRGRFSVWSLSERPGSDEEALIVASEKSRKPLPTGKIHVGGMALEAKSTRDAWVEKCFLAHFYMEA